MKSGFHARKLIALLQSKGRDLSPLTILTHDYPDPDALASAWSLAHLAHALAKIRARIVYGGAIGRACSSPPTPCATARSGRRGTWPWSIPSPLFATTASPPGGTRT